MKIKSKERDHFGSVARAVYKQSFPVISLIAKKNDTPIVAAWIIFTVSDPNILY